VGYDGWLAAQGFSPHVRQLRVWQLGQLSLWLEGEGLGIGDWVDALAARFAAAHRTAGYRTYRSSLSLRVPIAYLRGLGVVGSEPAACDPVEELFFDLGVYLERERGLATGTIANYERAARLFLEDRVERHGGLLLDQLTSGDVSSFLVRECPRRSVVAAMNLAANLRALLRYLHVVGLIEVPLVRAVPRVADLRGRPLPKGLSPGTVAGMLASCEADSVIGRRDRAVLLLLLRLGLRRGEVAAIVLEDIDWRAGELLVRGKGHRQERMPLPVDVGEAIVSYLRVRPDSEHRALFLCVCTPSGPVSRACVTTIVQRSCRRAGLPPVGAHRLRHTAASEMLRARVPLQEIAQVLRHRDLKTTVKYARVDRDSLSALALPWPGGRS
jgi:site-specific recombinase XerD